MITVKIGDGLGNQIYNYVCGYSLAKTRGEKLCLDISDAENNPIRSYMLDNFCLDECKIEYFPNKTLWDKIYKRFRRNLKYHVVKEIGYASYSDNSYLFEEKSKGLRPTYLHGYWQSIRYFEMYEEDIRRQLVPSYAMPDGLIKLIEDFRSRPTCAIHMRGGDIAMPESDYYIKAVKYMTDKKPGLEYVIFTNDIENAKSRLAHLDICYKFIEDYEVENKFSDMDSFFLLSSCQNQIISESTFSTWAAILNDYRDKLVIAPKAEEPFERCPKDWIFI